MDGDDDDDDDDDDDGDNSEYPSLGPNTFLLIYFQTLKIYLHLSKRHTVLRTYRTMQHDCM
jgi:hypothetical protein